MRIVLDADSVGVDGQWTVRWSDIREIAAWKDDLFGYDIICMGFRTGNHNEYFKADEEQEGWNALRAEVESRYGARGWWEKVAYPAFARNWTVLWRS
jgi:hypothetical protein